MSLVMASNPVTDCTDDCLTLQTDVDEDVSQVTQTLEHVESRLVTLSERIHFCNAVLIDLKDLRDVLARKSAVDASIPPQK